MFNENTVNSLLEIRQRLIYCLICYGLLFIIFFYHADVIFNLLSAPLLKFLPKNSSLIASNITTPVIMPITLAMNIALFSCLPFCFYHIWRFVAPALYPKEKKYIIPLVSISILLFLTGILFAYCFMLPMMFGLFVSWLPNNVAIMADINNYLEFTFHIFLILGLVFQIPLIIIVLMKLNIITYHYLIHIRSYFIIGAFITAMFLTPPDVMSMIMLAVPICLLYEIGILFGRLMAKKSHRQ